MVLEWMNSLCPRLHHLLQVGFRKEFMYDFELASKATQNSIKMLHIQKVGHFIPLYSSETAEVTAASSVREGDESALRTIISLWRSSPLHSWNLYKNNSLGIGFAYDPREKLLYATVRLGN